MQTTATTFLHEAFENDQEEYVERVFERSILLVRNKVWNGIEESRLRDWIGAMSNFQAKLLAAYILDNLCFRSKEQYSSLLSYMAENTEIVGENGDKCSFIEAFNGKGNFYKKNKLYLVPVVSSDQPPTKSGPYILRLLQKQFRLKSENMLWPHKLLDKKQDILQLFFIDDFCGSGDQFVEFIKNIGFEKIVNENEIKVYYLVTVIHENGFNKIKKLYPNLEIIYSEFLDENITNILSEECMSRYQIAGFRKTIIEQYDMVVSKAEYPQSATNSLKFGYGGLGLAFSFFHGTPNNSLPLLWMEGKNITPFVDR